LIPLLKFLLWFADNLVKAEPSKIHGWLNMIGCYATGIFPRSKELVEVTRLYERGKISNQRLEKAFDKATVEIIDAQSSANFSYVTDGMLKWQDLMRPFAANIHGLKVGGLARWFNNNLFYRKPIVISEIEHEESIIEHIIQLKFLPKASSWKAILLAPYTFAQLCENHFYKNKSELMFKYAEILRDEIKRLVEVGFSYVQLSDPALVCTLDNTKTSTGKLASVKEALRIITEGTSVKTCLQTFFGDFSQILPEAIDFPVDHLGIDLCETNFEILKEYSFEKGVALGLVNCCNSLLEDPSKQLIIAKEILEAIYPSKICDVFVCPNCDLEFLPLDKAVEKMRVTATVASLLKEEL